MIQVTIDNPIINSPFDEPRRHFKFSDEGITQEIEQGRRRSEYFMPVARPKKKSGQQLSFGNEFVPDHVEPNEFVNRLRDRVAIWRVGGYQGVTNTTRALLDYWTNPAREKKLFFCQIEALETVIYVTEVAHKYGDNWIANDLRQANEEMNPELYRLAFKMATGSGKTVVMGMLIAWHALNKFANRQDTRFTDSFLLVAPGITIRDRLQVLQPGNPENYYRQRDILSPDQIARLGEARIAIINYHAMMLREQVSAGKLTKEVLTKGKTVSPFTETPDQMVRRVCRTLGNKKSIVVINDEAHHCYRARESEEKLKGDERIEAKKRDEEARVWLSGLEAIQRKIGVKTVYDLSATPFYLKGSGYPEGKIFPWVISDFSLIDAIESGIVKVPRVPVLDNSMVGDFPTYRNLWVQIRDKLPKKGRKQTQVGNETPKLPSKLEGALQSLYSHYEKVYQQWENDPALQAAGQTPPVFIVVCNNTTVSKLVYDWVSGWEKPLPNGESVFVPGNLAIFSNELHGRRRPRPNTILVDSEQLESGESMSRDFKQIAAAEIDAFKLEYSRRHPGQEPTDEDILREVMNTVGKKDKLGEPVKCVVSVSMLTEGWDANTVTHILGIRAFGTQLICEQVVGRALRRISYATDENGHFTPEYAEVFGVPFSLFMPQAGTTKAPQPGPQTTRVRAMEQRQEYTIEFPRVIGYRYEHPAAPLQAKFTNATRMTLTTKDVPTQTENAPIVGESVIMDLGDLQSRRVQEVDFLLAKLILEKYFRTDPDPAADTPGQHRFAAEVQAWRFPQLVPIVREWRETCLQCKDDTFPQLLLMLDFAHTAADYIYQAIQVGQLETAAPGQTLKPILRPYDPLGSTAAVDFDTTRPTFQTTKSHVSHVALDSSYFEAKIANGLESMPEVTSYVKNDQMGFTIPYTLGIKERSYVPDYIAQIDDGQPDPLNLIIEVSGEKRSDKDAKVAAAKNLWIPAINNHGGFGRWAFIEITDPEDAKNTIYTILKDKSLTVNKKI